MIEGQSFVLDLEDENDKRKALLRVEIIDVNDNAPQFLNIPAQIFVDEVFKFFYQIITNCIFSNFLTEKFVMFRIHPLEA